MSDHYDRYNGMENLLGTNLAEVGTDCISRQAAIETVMECYDNDELFEVYEDKLRELPPAFATDINVGDKDTISRKAAIDAVNCVMIMKGIRSGKSVAAEAVESAKSIIADNIRQLPPAQPEPHWIPVTEATPTEDDDYWATFEAETGRFVDWASWYQGRWVVWIEGSPAPLSNVIAWCKPMEPYKGVTE